MHHSTIVMPMADDDAVVMESLHRPVSMKDESTYRHFLSLSNPQLFQQYKINQKRNFDVVAVLPLLITFYIGISTRLNLGNSYKQHVPGASYFTASITILLAGFTVAMLYFVSHMVIYKTAKDNRDGFYYRMSEKILTVWFGGRIEDVIGILGVLTIGMFLISRVVAGQCESMTDIWLSQSCNPVASASSIPHDQVILLYSTPMLAQIIIKGISVEALTLSWLLIVVFVVYAIVLVNGWFQIWTILYVIIFINISYEFERLMRVSFLHNKEMLTAEAEKRRSLKIQQEADTELMTIRSRHQIEISQMSCENEKKLRCELDQLQVLFIDTEISNYIRICFAVTHIIFTSVLDITFAPFITSSNTSLYHRETESAQLRSLMGNVAHDLKTPLHSIEADLEVLNKFISRIPQQLLNTLIKDFQVDCGGDSCDPQSVFNSLTATCQFMVMAINRSQDFMKATNNIALTPEMETFDLKAAVEMSVTCINHLQTARTIVVHPYPAEICMHVISDKHWLSENILCLLSNALKYSDGGDVDVRIKLTDIAGLKKESFMRRHSRVAGAPRRITWTGTGEDEKKDLSIIRSPTHSETPKRVLLVTVEDNGIGISDEARQTLFQPFKQAQRMAGGTGLGLFSLLKRVEALGGNCGVGSRTDGKEGCIFWFTFPYRPDHGAADHDAVVSQPATQVCTSERVEYPVTPRKILLIDDSLSILKVVSRLLKLNGHTVDTASNGLLGLEKLKKTFDTEDYDMVLTDLQMPIMDGIEATDRYRKFESEENSKKPTPGANAESKKRLLIVGMSANSDEQSKRDALETGMDYFFTKPFAYKDLQPILLHHQEQYPQFSTI